jgi:hypothetical protein
VRSAAEFALSGIDDEIAARLLEENGLPNTAEARRVLRAPVTIFTVLAAKHGSLAHELQIRIGFADATAQLVVALSHFARRLRVAPEGVAILDPRYHETPGAGEFRCEFGILRTEETVRQYTHEPGDESLSTVIVERNALLAKFAESPGVYEAICALGIALDRFAQRRLANRAHVGIWQGFFRPSLRGGTYRGEFFVGDVDHAGEKRTNRVRVERRAKKKRPPDIRISGTDVHA